MELAVAVAADPDWVWALVLDVGGWPALTPSVTAVERLEAGPLALGSRTRLHQPRMGPLVWTVTALEPGTSFTWENSSPGVRTVATHAVAPAPGGTKLTLTFTQRGPLAPLVGLLTGRRTARYVAQEGSGFARAALG